MLPWVVTTIAVIVAAGALVLAVAIKRRSAAEIQRLRGASSAAHSRFGSVVDLLLTGAAVEDNAGRIVRLNSRIDRDGRKMEAPLGGARGTATAPDWRWRSWSARGTVSS